MSEVHVRLKMDGFVLEFQGRRGTFERGVEPLLMRLATGSRRNRTAPNGAPKAEETAPTETAPLPSTAVSAPVGVPEEAESVPAGYRPPGDRFGTFLRSLRTAEEGAEERIAAYAFFLWNYERKETFSQEELAGCFEAAEQAVPTSPDELLEILAERRILAPGAANGSWRLTPKGQTWVRGNLLGG